jgi:hypothetical protein
MLVGSYQRWQLGDVARDASRLVHGEHMGCISLGASLAAVRPSYDSTRAKLLLAV